MVKYLCAYLRIGKGFCYIFFYSILKILDEKIN